MIQKFYKIVFPDFFDIEDESIRKKIITANQLIVYTTAVTCFYLIIGYWKKIDLVLYASIWTVLLFLFLGIALRFKKYNFSRIAIIVLANLDLYFACVLLGYDPGFHLFFFPLILLPLLIIDNKEKEIFLSTIFISPALVIVLFLTNFSFIFHSTDSKIFIPFASGYLTKINFFMALFSTFLCGTYLTFIYIEKDKIENKNISKIEESRIGLQTLINSIRDGLITIDKNYILLNSNSIFQIQMYELFKTRVEIGENILESLSNHLNTKYLAKLIDSCFEGKSLTIQSKIHEYYFDISLNPILFDNSIQSIIIITREITELKTSQQNLIENKENLQALISSLDDIVFETNENFTYEGIWTQNESLLLYPIEYMIGKSFDDILSVEVSSRFKDTIRVLIQTKQAQVVEYSLVINGIEKWFQASFTLFYRDNDGRPKVSVLVRDITEKKEFILKLIEAKEIAEKSKKQESQFLSNMSHEIRTPLYGVIGLTEIILLESLESKVRKNTELIKYSAGNLLSIVNDILDYSKIENEKIDIHHDSFSLKELSEHLAKTTESLVHEKNIKISFEIDSSIPDRIIGDALRLGQVIQNLLTNAAKFTEDGYIKLKISQVKKDIDSIQIEFIVEDTGIGIENSELDSIFTAYFQKDNRFVKIKGTGLGLAITKKIVEIFQGEISVKSELGKGTQFKVILDFELQKSETSLKKASEPMSAKAFVGVLVLLVDDYEMNRFVGSEILKNWGTTVEFAEEGLEAIQKTKNKKYDIIIMDIQMPSMSGDEVTLMIRADKNNLNQNTPILALSADVFEEIKVKALKSGMNDFINKPFQLEELYNAIKRNLPNQL